MGVLKRMDSDYVFDFGIEVLDKSEKRYENEVELRPLGAQLTGSITNGVTVGTLLGDVDEQFVFFFFFFFFLFVCLNCIFF